jgi:hypothetical protein
VETVRNRSPSARRIIFAGGGIDLDAPTVWDYPPALDPDGDPPAGLRLPVADAR